MVVWPDDIPCKIIAGGYEKAFRDGRLRTEPQRGRPFRRVMTSAAVVPVVAQTLMTVGQVARLERFWEEDLEGGVLPFAIRDNVYHGHATFDESGHPVLTSEGEVIRGVYYWVVQFRNAPSTRRLGATKRVVTLDLEVL